MEEGIMREWNEPVFVCGKEYIQIVLAGNSF